MLKIFTRANGDELQSGVNMLVRVYIAQKRKIRVGDKMAGRPRKQRGCCPVLFQLRICRIFQTEHQLISC